MSRRRYMFALTKPYRHIIPPKLLPKRGGRTWIKLKFKIANLKYYEQ